MSQGRYPLSSESKVDSLLLRDFSQARAYVDHIAEFYARLTEIVCALSPKLGPYGVHLDCHWQKEGTLEICLARPLSAITLPVKTFLTEEESPIISVGKPGQTAPTEFALADLDKALEDIRISIVGALPRQAVFDLFERLPQGDPAVLGSYLPEHIPGNPDGNMKAAAIICTSHGYRPTPDLVRFGDNQSVTPAYTLC